MVDMRADYRVTFPTLGDVVDAWIAQHARVPDRAQRGAPFVPSDWQFWVRANFYRVREHIEYEPDLFNQAFVFRRALVVGPQKLGKGPDAAAGVAAEAVGPTQFAGWAGVDDGYVCADNGCGCGWEYAYEPGEAMGARHPSPLIQCTAISEDQVANVWRPLRAMTALGPLSDLLSFRDNWVKIAGSSPGELELDRIDKVTSSALSRLGNPITFAVQDESGQATASNKMRAVYETQRRGAAGMGGRTIEYTNTWDPAQNSVAQTTWEGNAPDVFKFWREPPANLSYRNKRERREIHRFVYFGSPWVNLESVEAEAAELLATDPAQAERFFGNRVVAGQDSWFTVEQFHAFTTKRSERERPTGGPVCLGFDGSDVDDWTAIRAETLDGFAFTPTDHLGRRTIWNPKATAAKRIPRDEVYEAARYLLRTFDVQRFYLDPPGFESMIADLQGEFGTQRVVDWATYRLTPMHAELERYRTDWSDPASRFVHDGDQFAEQHVRNAQTRPRPRMTYILGKPADHQKIDVTMASVLAHAAAADAIAANDLEKRRPRVSNTYYGFS